MLNDHRNALSSESKARAESRSDQRQHLDKIKDVLRAIDPQVKALIANHREKSVRWMPHEVAPWGEGEDFVTKPWSPEQSRLRPEIASALETHLLTEDNLPYYHAIISNLADAG